MKKLTRKDINKIIENHQHWLRRDCEGWESMRADLYGANLRGANLYGVNLYGANLRGANLYGANLRRATLRGANLCEAGLGGADLHGVDLCEADLCGANLYGADLRGVNLRGADLYEADLRGANLCGAKNVPYIPMICPEEGSFIGWKKVEDYIVKQDYIIKLEIPAEAKRSSATTRKCRCEFAKVLDIFNMDGTKANIDEITNNIYEPLKYKIGEVVYPDGFDEDRWAECSNGIHFFVNRQEAINY